MTGHVTARQLIARRQSIQQKPKSANHFQLAVAFLLGAGSIWYVSLIGYVKIVDACVVFAFLTRFTNVPTLFARNRPLIFLCLSFLAVCAPLAWGSEYAETSPKPYLAAVSALLCFIVVISFGVSEVKAVVVGLGVSTTLVVLWSLANWKLGVSSMGIPLWYFSRFGRSVIATMTDPNRFALVLLVVLSFAASLALANKYKILSLAWMVFMLYAIFLTGSRQGLALGVIVTCIAGGTVLVRLQWIRVRGWFTNLVIVFFAAIALATIGVLFLSQSEFVSERLENTGIVQKIREKGMDLENDPRLMLMGLGIKAARENPLGLGMDGYKNRFTYTPHNNYIEVLTGGGYLALAFHLAFMISMGLPILRAWSRGNATKKDRNRAWYVNIRMMAWCAIVILQMSLEINYMVFAYLVLGVLANSKTEPTT